MVLTVRLNACNFALRLCPEGERAGVLEKAADAARALESTIDPIGRMQRAFYFQLIGDEPASVDEWRQAVQRGGVGLFASYYAAAMFRQERSAEALEFLDRGAPSTDGLTAVARACLLLDQERPEEAERVHQQVVAQSTSSRLWAETVRLLAGQSTRVATDCARLLEATLTQHPDYPAVQFLAGQSSGQELLGRASASRCQRCTAHYWIALRTLAQGDRKTAIEHFAHSLETGTHWLPVFQWSRAFLARVGQDPHWPPWIHGEENC
jgi:tetratricopeptide (TPR) repeat protein